MEGMETAVSRGGGKNSRCTSGEKKKSGRKGAQTRVASRGEPGGSVSSICLR